MNDHDTGTTTIAEPKRIRGRWYDLESGACLGWDDIVQSQDAGPNGPLPLPARAAFVPYNGPDLEAEHEHHEPDLDPEALVAMATHVMGTEIADGRLLPTA